MSSNHSQHLSHTSPTTNMLALSMIPILSRQNLRQNEDFEALRSRAFALLPQVWKFYNHETNKTRILAELFTRSDLELNANPTARALLGNEIVIAHDAAKAHFENWMYLHELVDAQNRSELTTWQFRRVRSIIHEVELFIEHEKAVRENILLWREYGEPTTGEVIIDSPTEHMPAHDVIARDEAFADE